MNNKFRKPDSFSLEFNIFFVKAILKWERSKEELEKKEKELRKKLNEAERKGKSADKLVAELKEIAEQYASLYFSERNLLVETIEIWKESKETTESFYTEFREEYKKSACSNCWNKYKLLWENKTKEIENKICRRCSKATKTQNTNLVDKEKGKIKKYLKLDLDDNIFNGLCINCSNTLANAITAFYNYKNVPKEFIAAGGEIGKSEYNKVNGNIKIREGERVWEFSLENQGLNYILELMNF